MTCPVSLFCQCHPKIPSWLWESGQKSTAHFPTTTTTASPPIQDQRRSLPPTRPQKGISLDYFNFSCTNKSRILTPSTLLLVVHIKAAMTGTNGAAIDNFPFLCNAGQKSCRLLHPARVMTRLQSTSGPTRRIAVGADQGPQGAGATRARIPPRQP
jgi:hypothetical protein